MQRDSPSPYQRDVLKCNVRRVTDDEVRDEEDCVAVEEPMEIRLVFGPTEKRVMRSLAVTMRTPGQDQELALGFLLTEGMIESTQQVDQVVIRGVDQDGLETGNIVRVELATDVELDWSQLQRNFFTHSSCGVCGKASLEALQLRGVAPLPDGQLIMSQQVVQQLGETLKEAQPTFRLTGGLHAAAFATTDGTLLQVREDVGRHNAVDKLIGYGIQEESLSMEQVALVNSGRASFEIMQKALMAKIPFIVAVGAPTSLAVDVAKQYNMTLVGFASRSRFNIYAGAERVSFPG